MYVIEETWGIYDHTTMSWAVEPEPFFSEKVKSVDRLKAIANDMNVFEDKPRYEAICQHRPCKDFDGQYVKRKP